MDAEGVAGFLDTPGIDVVVPSLSSSASLASTCGRFLQSRHSGTSDAEVQKHTRQRQHSPSVTVVRTRQFRARLSTDCGAAPVDLRRTRALLPHAKKYETSVPLDPERSEYDGVVELYFEDMGALQAAFESEVGQEVQADLENFVNPDEGPTLYLDETVQMGDTA